MSSIEVHERSASVVLDGLEVGTVGHPSTMYQFNDLLDCVTRIARMALPAAGAEFVADRLAECR